MAKMSPEELDAAIERYFVRTGVRKRQAELKAQDILFKEQIAEKIDDLPDEDKAELAYLYDEWSGDGVDYEADDIVRVGDMPYRVVLDHTSQPDWTPETQSALFTPLRNTSGPNPDPWVQPTGAQDAYASGARATHPNPNDNDNVWIYESAIDANTTVPGQNGDQFWTPIEVL